MALGSGGFVGAASGRKTWIRGASVVGLLAAVAVTLPQGTRRVAADAPPPSIVFIVSDDQHAGTLWAMPNVQSELVQHGVTFSNAFVSNPVCCPSRASILSGLYSHSTGVYANGGKHGGFPAFVDSSSLATWLKADGYTTALVGKYLNEYTGTYIPPGWDDWVAFEDHPRTGGAYYDYTLNVQGSMVSHGSAPEDYSTDVLAAYADAFIRTSTGPIFLDFTPFGPHGPTTPAPRHATADFQPVHPPSFNEAEMTDKPAWIQNIPPLSDRKIASLDRAQVNHDRTLLSVDDAVNTIVTALADTGRLSETLIVYLTDNGRFFGEHRLAGKAAGYEEAIHVDMVVRYDPLAATPRTDPHLVLNIDLAPTAAELTGITTPPVEGVSLAPLLVSPEVEWRTDFLGEHLFTRLGGPTYCQVRSEQYSYMMLATGEEELYDLAIDPYELENKAADPTYAIALQSLRDRMAVLCTPPPPGFDGGGGRMGDPGGRPLLLRDGAGS